MNSVVVAGLPGHFASWLAERLPRVTVQAAFSAAEAVDHARDGRTLVLIDLSVRADQTMDALRSLRGGPWEERGDGAACVPGLPPAG